METARAGRGRPTIYTTELADELCGRIIDSDYGLEQVCEAEDMPSARTVYRWISGNDDFRQRYTRAKEAQGHVQADRATRDALNATDAGLGRLKFDARKWQASKLAASQYGDKIAHVGGGPGDAPIQYANLTEEEIDARLAALAAAAQPNS